MSTGATQMIRELAAEWADLPDYPSAIESGIVGDASHLAGGGYHISIEDNKPGNYSVTRPDDAAPPGNWPRNVASGIDTSMALNDLTKCHNRLKTLWQNRAWDTRAKYINAFNGWDGQGTPGRYDMVSGNVSETDSSHEFHEHLEVRRKYVNDYTAKKAILSALKGETHDQYLAGGDQDVNSLQAAQLNNAMEYARSMQQWSDQTLGNISDDFAGTTDTPQPNLYKQEFNKLRDKVNNMSTVLDQVLTIVQSLASGGAIEGGTGGLSDQAKEDIRQIVDEESISKDEIS